uniref:KxYKxGKxW signal peptide domain-containing protein n=1 Tax=Brevibacillus choshinensis TaxID=54911 RepID=UPI0038B28187
MLRRYKSGKRWAIASASCLLFVGSQSRCCDCQVIAPRGTLFAAVPLPFVFPGAA